MKDKIVIVKKNFTSVQVESILHMGKRAKIPTQ